MPRASSSQQRSVSQTVGYQPLRPGLSGARPALAGLLALGLWACGGDGSGPTDGGNPSGNHAPTASAGAGQSVHKGASVTLSGSGADPDGDTLAFAWTQTAGPAVTLSSAAAAAPTFTAPSASGDLTFSLVVSDGKGGTSPASSVTITVTNRAPVANAGAAQTGKLKRSTVTLDGSGSSDPDPQDTLTYAWVQTSGEQATLSSATAAKPTFTAPGVSGTLTFRLVVSDSEGDTSQASTVSVAVINRAPVADAGLDQPGVSKRATVTLSGGASTDPDGDTLTYAWSRVSGPSVTLAGAATAAPTFTAPGTSGSLVLQLIVNDGETNSVADQVTIAVLNQLPLPSATFTPQTPAGSGKTGKYTLVTLDASASSDPDGDTLTYSWAPTSGTPPALSNTHVARPTFTTPALSGTFSYDVTISDGEGSATATVLVGAENKVPVANAGANRTVKPSSVVTLLGSGTDGDASDPRTYAWTQTAGTSVTLSSAAVAQPTFTAPAANGALTFQLVVSDNEDGSPASTVTITLGNTAPVAWAGAGSDTWHGGETVVLDGSGSSDADGDRLFYSWALAGGPGSAAPASATAQSAVAAVPNTVSSAVTYDLSVDDSYAAPVTASVTNNVLPYGGSRNSWTQFVNPLADGSATIAVLMGDVDATASYVFVGDATAGLKIFNKGNPATLLFTLTPGGASAVGRFAVQGSTLYVLSGTGTTAQLWLFDLGTLPGTIPTALNAGLSLGLGAADSVADLAVSGTNAFVTCGTAGLKVVNVATPATPAVVGTLPPSAGSDWWGGVAVSGTKVVVAATSGLRIIDVSTPSTPVEAGAYTTVPGFATSSVAVTGTTAYLGFTDQTVAVINAATPASPVLATTLGVAGATSTCRLALAGTRLYASRATPLGVEAYDLTTPAAPALLGRFATDSSYNGLFAQGSTLFLQEGLTLNWFDATSVPGATVTLPGSVSFNGAPSAVAAMGQLALVIRSGQLDVIDLANPLAPVTLRSGYRHDTNWSYTDVAVKGRYAVVTDYANGIAVLDLRNPASPSMVSTYSPGGQTDFVRISGNYAFTSHASTAANIGVKITNLTNPAVPAFAATYTASGGQYYDNLIVAGKTLAVVYGSPAVVDLVDVTSPVAPVKKSTVSIPSSGSVAAMAMAGGLLVLSDSSRGTFVFDISNAASPVQVGPTLNVRPFRMWLAGNQLFMTSLSGDTTIYDLATPATPVRLGRLRAGPTALAVAGNLALVAKSGTLAIGDWQPVLSTRYSAASVNAQLPYGVSWRDSVPASTVTVRCRVTGGTCAVTAVDQTANTATVSWTLPAATGDHEIVISVGDYGHFTSALDRLLVTPAGLASAR